MKNYKGLFLCNDVKYHSTIDKNNIFSFLNFSKYNIVKVEPYDLDNINILNFDQYHFKFLNIKNY